MIAQIILELPFENILVLPYKYLMVILSIYLTKNWELYERSKCMLSYAYLHSPPFWMKYNDALMSNKLQLLSLWDMEHLQNDDDSYEMKIVWFAETAPHVRF